MTKRNIKVKSNIAHLTYGDFAEGPNQRGYLKITRMTSKDFYLTKYDLEKMMKLYEEN